MIYFREVQRLWTWVLLLLVLAVPIAAIARSLPHFSGHAPPERVIYLVCAPLALMVLWFSLGRMVTEVRETGLSIHFHLLWPERLIPWTAIRGAEATTYFATGWGVRFGAQGMTYNVSGNRGVRIDLGDGESVQVGSQRASELADAIAQRLAARVAQ
jgi:hypothetical protein